MPEQKGLSYRANLVVIDTVFGAAFMQASSLFLTHLRVLKANPIPSNPGSIASFLATSPNLNEVKNFTIQSLNNPEVCLNMLLLSLSCCAFAFTSVFYNGRRMLYEDYDLI